MRRVDTMSAASDFYKQLSPVRSPVLRSLPYRIALYDFLLDSSPLPGSDSLIPRLVPSRFNDDPFILDTEGMFPTNYANDFSHILWTLGF